MSRGSASVYSLRNRTETTYNESNEVEVINSGSDTLTASSEDMGSQERVVKVDSPVTSLTRECECLERPLVPAQIPTRCDTSRTSVLPAAAAVIEQIQEPFNVALDRISADAVVTEPIQTAVLGHVSIPSPEVFDLDRLGQMLLNLQVNISSIQSDISSVRTDLQSDISSVRTDLQSDISSVRTDLQSDISSVRTDLQSDISSVRTELQSGLFNIETCLRTDLNILEGRLESKFREQHKTLEQLADRVSQGQSQVEQLESRTKALLVTATQERQELKRQCSNNHSAIREETLHLSERLDHIEETTSILSNRVEAIGGDVMQVAEKAVEAKTFSLSQRVEQHYHQVEAHVQSLERRVHELGSALINNHIPRTEIENSSTLKESRSQDTAPDMPVVDRQILNTPANITSLDPAALIHHPARQWSESMPTFSGKSSENPVRFLNKFEEYVKTFGLSDTEKLRCLSTALKSHAFYWWEIQLNTTHSYEHFKEKFRQQYWNLRIQGNLRAQLHTERYDPKRGASLEAHISSMYERTRYLDLAMTDEEFIATVSTQLPLKYQMQLSGRSYKDVTDFREQLLLLDKLERLHKSQFSKEESETKVTYPKHQPVHNYWQSRDSKQREDRQAVVNLLEWESEENPRRNQQGHRRKGGYHSQRSNCPPRHSGPYRSKTWWSSNQKYHSDNEDSQMY
ncbi:uncharacterized protein LOC134536700 [Bacillus rossius redtenbacheri]|uniref:uncharacterized protein LOC134536700 n=1 Tax=Bacillus rossius redtenbacheri TaxID=93214 RepID=UPI002FDE38F5